MSIKYNEFGEVISVNGLTTGQHLGTPMQDATPDQPEDNEVYATQRNTVGNSENVIDDTQPIRPGGGSTEAVLYTEQKLTEEQKSQARENIGAAKEQIPLSASQINALDALFKAAYYFKDASAEYAAFCDAFGITKPEDRTVVIDDIRRGSVSFSNGYMTVATQSEHVAHRATVIPIGQYLKIGATYRVSLGSASNAYFFGVQLFVAQSADMTFDYEAEQFKEYTNVTERILDDGWNNTDYEFTVNRENCILAVNFKNSDNSVLSENDYKTLLANFTIKEVV